MSIGRNRTRSDRECPVKVDRIRYATDVPQLEQNSPIGVVDPIRHAFPTGNLFLRPNTWRIRITDTHRGNGGGLRNNQASAGALLVVLAHQIVWDPPLAGSTAGERSHDNAIG